VISFFKLDKEKFVIGQKEVTKAVFPAAGLGTRFLPATKASPKEMLPLVDKPLIQYVVEEAKSSGITDIIVITGRGKRAIEDHFDTSFELEATLEKKGSKKSLKELRKISHMVNFSYVRQGEALGLGHAVLCAESLVGNEPFAVLLGDDIIDAETPCLKQMLNIFKRFRSSVIAVQKVPKDQIGAYGVIDAEKVENGLYLIKDMVEKPPPEKAPSNLAVIGRYILTPEVFRFIREVKPGKGGEIQLTDALKAMAREFPLYGYVFEGKRYDAGNKLGFLEATVEYALKDPVLGADFRRYLKSLKL
jgi:UTP--glucose-1-phosphate uridylyltransferase